MNTCAAPVLAGSRFLLLIAVARSHHPCQPVLKVFETAPKSVHVHAYCLEFRVSWVEGVHGMNTCAALVLLGSRAVLLIPLPSKYGPCETTLASIF